MRLLNIEEEAAQMAQRFAISEQTLYRWRDQFIQARRQTIHGGGSDASVRRLLNKKDKQLAARDQVIGELTIVNRFLEKCREVEGVGRVAVIGCRVLWEVLRLSAEWDFSGAGDRVFDLVCAAQTKPEEARLH